MHSRREWNILLVEDSPDQASLILRILKQNNSRKITIHWHRDGQAARAFLNAPNTPEISLIILEIEALDPNGLELMKQIRSPSSPFRITPIIVLSRSQDQTALKEYYSSGLNSWVQKPSDIAAFQQTIEFLAEFWLKHSILPRSRPLRYP